MTSSNPLSVNYLPPRLREIAFEEEAVVCASPSPGGNEDIEYEEW